MGHVNPQDLADSSLHYALLVYFPQTLTFSHRCSYKLDTQMQQKKLIWTLQVEGGGVLKLLMRSEIICDFKG